MKRIYSVLFISLVTLITSCQTAAEKASGTYNGTWSASGPGFTTSSGVGNASLVITADGAKRVDMSFSSPGNPTVNIQNVDITDIVGTYILDISDDMGGNISLSGTIASNILALNYDNAMDTVSVQLAAFSK